jgi:hypothetical protein
VTDAVTVALIAGVPATLAVVLGFLNRSKLGAVSVQMDGRLSELLELTRKSSHAEGVKDEQERPFPRPNPIEDLEKPE